jgi:hypothetical protein
VRFKLLAVAAAAATLVAGPSPGEPGPAGYLTPATAPDTLKILPPSPKAGDRADGADQAVFRAHRGGRWRRTTPTTRRPRSSPTSAAP